MSNCEEYFVHIFTMRCYSRSLSAPGYSICGLDSQYGSFKVHWSRTFHSWHGKINFSPFEIVWAWRCVHVLNVRKTTVRWWILQRASTLPCLSLWAIYWKDNFNWNWKSQNERDMVCAKSAQSVRHLVQRSLLPDRVQGITTFPFRTLQPATSVFFRFWCRCIFSIVENVEPGRYVECWSCYPTQVNL